MSAAAMRSKMNLDSLIIYARIWHPMDNICNSLKERHHTDQNKHGPAQTSTVQHKQYSFEGQPTTSSKNLHYHSQTHLMTFKTYF